LPSSGQAEQLEQTSKGFPCLLLEVANMRGSLHVLVSKGVPTVVATARRPHRVFDPDQTDCATAPWLKEEVGADPVQTSPVYSGSKPWRVEG
jgi:hypothetical protein